MHGEYDNTYYVLSMICLSGGSWRELTSLLKSQMVFHKIQIDDAFNKI